MYAGANGSAPASSGEPKEERPPQTTEVTPALPKKDGDEPTASVGDKQAWAFHLVMTIASLYMAMLLTNWGSLNEYV
jgi:hypothetical protein